MPVVRGNRLTLVHRASCGKAEDAILLEDIPRNEWIQMIYHFRVSQKNDGFLRVWIETLDNIDALDQNKPLFEHIGNFGFGLWDSNDVLQVRPSSDRTNWTDLKFGMYNHSSRDYDQDEERWLFYDDMMNINGNPENAFLMSQGYVNEQGLYDSAVSIKKAISSQVLGEPTNEAEAAEKRVSESERIERLYQAKKATLSPERLAWEILLEENLGNDFYLPIHKRDFVNGVSTGWDFVADDPNLPRVLLIGDSISRGYTLPTRKVLAGKANVHRAPENCRHTANGLQKLDMWLGTKKWDVIHFNFGIHDRRTPIPEYINRLTQIVTRLQATGATLIWATTTPVPYDPKKERTDTSIVERNAAAAVLMERHSIAINDLYTAIKPHLATLQKPKQDVHFKAAGNEFLANRVAEAIQSKILAESRR